MFKLQTKYKKVYLRLDSELKEKQQKDIFRKDQIQGKLK